MIWVVLGFHLCVSRRSLQLTLALVGLCWLGCFLLFSVGELIFDLFLTSSNNLTATVESNAATEKKKGLLASFGDWFGSINMMNILYIWFPASWGPSVVEAIQKRNETWLAKNPIVRDPYIFNRAEAAMGSLSREVTCKIQKWNIKADGFHPILVANARVDWLALKDDDITKKFPILLEGILQDVFSQRASSAWQGAQPQKLTVSMLLPGTSTASEWRAFRCVLPMGLLPGTASETRTPTIHSFDAPRQWVWCSALASVSSSRPPLCRNLLLPQFCCLIRLCKLQVMACPRDVAYHLCVADWRALRPGPYPSSIEQKKNCFRMARLVTIQTPILAHINHSTCLSCPCMYRSPSTWTPSDAGQAPLVQSGYQVGGPRGETSGSCPHWTYQGWHLEASFSHQAA